MILHVDMDAFYVSVEERDNAALRGRPAVVGGSPAGRGVVAAANYAARQYGIHSAMSMARAKRLCPRLILIRPRHAYYAEMSRQIQAVFARYTPLIEPLSLDEAFLDVTHSATLFGAAPEIGRRIKHEIKEELQLTASVGIAANKFVAKVASDVNKPDGFLVIEPGAEQAFLDPLPVSKLWGVGRVANSALERLEVKTIAEFRRLPPETLRALFGKWGEQLGLLAQGIDHRGVVPDRDAKSISHETTFSEDVSDPEILRDWLLELTGQVARRLRQNQITGRTVQLKLRFSDFKTITRAHTLAAPTDITQQLRRAAADLLAHHLPIRHDGIRLLGVGVTNLEARPPLQHDLLDETGRAKQRRLDAVADRIRTRFGAAAMRRGRNAKLAE